MEFVPTKDNVHVMPDTNWILKGNSVHLTALVVVELEVTVPHPKCAAAAQGKESVICKFIFFNLEF